MADLKVETVEPDPSANSIANDETINAEVSTDGPATKEEAETKSSTDATALIEEVKAVMKDVPTENEARATSGEVGVKAEGHTTTTTNGDNSDAKINAESAENESNNRNKREDKSRDAGKRYNERDRNFNKDRRCGGFRNGPKRDYSENVKSDLTSQKESSDPVEIRRQVEFYFSDSNLHTDKFLFSKVDGHKNNPVPISVIHSFKRMRHFQPYSALVDALKESKTLNVVENDTCIQRKVPLAEDVQDKNIYEVQKVYEDKAMARSVYLKGFGPEEPSTQFDIEAFFAPYGPTNSVRLRRTNEKIFKRSVFVEFDSDETAKAFLALDPKPKWKGNDLLIKSKKQYCDEKCDDIAAGKVKANQYSPRDQSKIKRKRDDDGKDWRERRDEDRKSGFQNKGHKGFGSSGRGRGGNRGGRGGRDRNDERTKQKNEHEVPKIAIPADDDGEIAKLAPSSTTIQTEKTESASNGATADSKSLANGNSEMVNTGDVSSAETSKKRSLEDDPSSEAQGNSKKVDVKSDS